MADALLAGVGDYDARGRVTAESKTIGSYGTYTTVWAYNIADQVTTMTYPSGEIVTQTYLTQGAVYSLIGDDIYVADTAYDNAGRPIEITPNGVAGNGARRYTYNTAGLLIRSEIHDGTAYQLQAEMVYNGMGQRLQMTAWAEGLSLTTHYTLDMASGASDLLSANADGNATFYLYAHGRPVGEMNNAWSYYLYDSGHTNHASAVPRQIVDANGAVTLMRSYTPWGEVMQQSGMGNFTWGYFGGLMDAATGLLYVGNGQYYDPATGRFLTPANQRSTNPYLPMHFDPIGALLGPVALVAWWR